MQSPTSLSADRVINVLVDDSSTDFSSQDGETQRLLNQDLINDTQNFEMTELKCENEILKATISRIVTTIKMNHALDKSGAKAFKYTSGYVGIILDMARMQWYNVSYNTSRESVYA